MTMRTQLEAYTHVLEQISNGVVDPAAMFDHVEPVGGACMYTAKLESGRVIHCGVGCLLTPELRTELIENTMNCSSIRALFDIHGAETIEQMTGLSRAQMVVLQREHDAACADKNNGRLTAYVDLLIRTLSQ